MPSERVQRRIDRLLDDAEQAMDRQEWTVVQRIAQEVLALDPDNQDGATFLTSAERLLLGTSAQEPTARSPSQRKPSSEAPSSFANGRYAVKKFLGEGGKKKVYLAHDTLLDRDVAFALIKTEGLDDIGRDRITREAQAMGRLGAHPHIVSVFDLGDENSQPYIVTELMGGGDVEGLIEKAPEHRPPLERTLEIGIQVCRGLEFAHSHGIVHRDLKPGNVWLTADGTAKLGDFGLAVALDKSRLTQAGMMVGTVSYMPPEQAMGGEVTPLSDLYSLGAMLYEMVTGRPPFVGGDSVAIITQHLNTDPVSPSWHNPAVPSGLEALIRRLLEKDPASRRSSATEVRLALEHLTRSTEAGTGTMPVPTEPQADQNPMYRRTFVGREPELRQLQAAYDGAVSGQGALAVVVGEPGIGKTSLTEQLATYATIRGGRTLVGHSYEEGSLSLPYLPFVEAMRSYVLAREPEALRTDLGSGAADVARIVSEVRERLHVEPAPANIADADEERYRLFQSITAFLRNAATVQPLVIVLEDLHDADRGTLDLLVHLFRNLEGARLLLIGTYRDVEVDRSHPLSSVLAELRRGAAVARVLLRGLTADEVQRMMSQLSGQDVPWRLAEAVHRQTEGNPLFIQEVLRYLVEEGLIKREEGRWRRASEETPLELGIPEGLRDVIGKRLSRLSERANQMLAVAAVMGREFRLDVLQRVAGLEEEPLYEALAEAKAVAVVEERAAIGAAVSYRFTHAFFRQTLYEETIAPRRIRLHQQVARALEAVYGRRLEEHAAELAEHYAYSSDPADLAKAVEYGELAAARAMSVFAYGEAARHLEQALKVQEVLNPDDKAKRCDLLLALGEALVSGGDTTRARNDIAPEALRAAEGLGDRARASRTCRLVHRTYSRVTGSIEDGDYEKWAELSDRYADAGTIERVYADMWLGGVASIRGRTAEGKEFHRKARQSAFRLGDVLAIVTCSVPVLMGAAPTPEENDERLALADAVSSHSLDGLPLRNLAIAKTYLGCVYLTWGRRAFAEQLWAEARRAATQSRDAEAVFVPLQIDAMLHTLDGQLEEVLDLEPKIRALGVEIDRERAGRQSAARAIRPALLYLGRSEDALAGIREVPDLFFNGGINSAQRCLCLAHMGRKTESADILRQMLSRRDLARSDDPTPTQALKFLLDAAVLLGDAGAARRLADRLSRMAGLLYSAAEQTHCIGRSCGAAAALYGDYRASLGHYQQAIEICTKVRFRPELALTRLELAELLLNHRPDERTAAIEHLDFAIAEFREMKMQPSLERALRHKEVLKA